jgi:hypothetical protein
MAKADPNHTCSLATIQTPPAEAAPRSRTLISAEDVASVFNDDYISRRTKRWGLPANADEARLAQGIRDAVQIYLRDVATPNENDIHREIARLHQAAHFRRYEASFELVTNLSPQARALLNRRNLSGVALLKDSSPLIDPAHQRRATEQLAALCRMGAKLKEGRKRPGGKRSKTFAPDLYAPPASRHFEKRAADRSFLMWLRMAWLEATGERQRAYTAQGDGHEGPFARLLCDCLELVGAKHVDGIALINEAKKTRFDQARKRTPYGLGMRSGPTSSWIDILLSANNPQ